ncbi:hypothetical protein AALB51_02845 [Lachnospiraceae bacterium 62-26]
MPGVTKEQIQEAREADLFRYLQFHEPGVLKRDGPNYRHFPCSLREPSARGISVWRESWGAGKSWELPRGLRRSWRRITRRFLREASHEDKAH